MPYPDRKPEFEPPRTIAEFVEIRRNNLVSARVLPRSAERNQMRQIALSLRALLKNRKWLNANTSDG
jgi:hypothetical protein